MQLRNLTFTKNSFNWFWVICLCQLGQLGCDFRGSSSTNNTETALPYANQKLIVACSDAAFAQEFTNRSKIWASRTGAQVEFIAWPKPNLDGNITLPDCDAIILPPDEVGEILPTGNLLPVPEDLFSNDHPLRRTGLLMPYRENLSRWGNQAFAIPVAGDGYVCVYRQDFFRAPEQQQAFRAANGKDLEAPKTWEDLAEIAKFFTAQRKQPALASLQNNPQDSLAQYYHLAACYDRPAVREVKDDPTGTAAKAALAFEIDPFTGQNRIQTAGFAAAMKWMEQTQPWRVTSGVPVADLVNGSAVIGILSLAELSQLPRDPSGAVEPRWGLCSMPGTQVFFDADGVAQPARNGSNYVPYFGGGLLSVVRKESKYADAAWDFLAELASPEGSERTLDRISLGVGPFRDPHVSSGEAQVRRWQRYDFDADRSKQLATSLRDYVDISTRNAAVTMRIPGQHQRRASLQEQLALVISGKKTAAQAIQDVSAAWKKIDDSVPFAKRLMWLQASAGLK